MSPFSPRLGRLDQPAPSDVHEGLHGRTRGSLFTADRQQESRQQRLSVKNTMWGFSFVLQRTFG